MLNKIKSVLKGVVNKVFNKSIIQKEFNIDIAINNEMVKAIDLWSNMYENKPPWLEDDIKTMGLPGAIANELARLVTVEFKSEIKNNKFLNVEYQNLIDNLRINCEYACARGGVVFKPYVNGKHIDIDIVQMDNFFPVSYNSQGNITAAIFLEVKIIGDKKYTRVEYHSFEGENYTIKNTAYEKNTVVTNDDTLGKQVSLSSVNEWADLEEELSIKGIDRPLFSYFRIPQANIIDNTSPLGVSVYAKAVDLIEEVDRQYSRILWEFEGSELAINASDSLFGLNKDGTPSIPERNKRLFRTFDFEGNNGDKLFREFSPQIRDASLFNGLNNLLRRIEFNSGLAYGTLSDITDTDKTATEIKASKQRSYSTVKDIQKALEKALKDLIICMLNLSKLYNLDNREIDIDKDVSFEWDDSIILDKDSELESMRNDVASGILRPEIYLSKKYGVSEEEALKMMPAAEESVKTKSPFDDLEE